MAGALAAAVGAQTKAKVSKGAAKSGVSKNKAATSASKRKPPAKSKRQTAKAKAKSKTTARARSRGQTRPTPERYKQIEQALAARGYLTEEPTGKWGPASVEALRSFQSDNQLPPTGKLDALSLIQLGLGPAQ